MTKVYAYVARTMPDEKVVIAVPDGTGHALCVSTDKHWTMRRPWSDLNVVAPLVEHEHNDDDEFDPLSKRGMEHVLRQLAEAKSEAAKWEDKYLDSDSKAHHATVEAEKWKNKYDESEIKRINAELHLGVSDEQLNDAQWKIRGLEADLEDARKHVSKLEDMAELRDSEGSGKVYNLETEVRAMEKQLGGSRDAHERTVDALNEERDDHAHTKEALALAVARVNELKAERNETAEKQDKVREEAYQRGHEDGYWKARREARTP